MGFFKKNTRKKRKATGFCLFPFIKHALEKKCMIKMGFKVAQDTQLHFMDASSHLYKRVCPSVRPSVCPLVHPSVRRLVTHELRPCKSAVFLPKLLPVRARTHLMPCIRPCFVLKAVTCPHAVINFLTNSVALADVILR